MKISSHCYALTGLGFIPPFEVNSGIIAGGTATMVVDTGPAYLTARTIYGYAQVVRPGNRMIAVNLEPHIDHFGGNSLFREKGVPLYGHTKLHRELNAIEQNAEEYNASVLDKQRRDLNEGRFFFQKSEVVLPENRIDSESWFDLMGVEAAVYPLPGHTAANMIVYVPADHVVFSADNIVTGYLPNLTAGNPELWKQWLTALAFIRKLDPKIVVPGHGDILEGKVIWKEAARIEEILKQAIDEA